MQPAPTCSAPACGGGCELLGYFSAGSCHQARNCGFYSFIFPPSYVAIWDSKTPHRPAGERFSWFLETSPLLRFPLWDGSLSLTLSSLFLFSYFDLPSFEDNRLPFGVPDVLCQHSEVVLWNLLSVQMFFQWIFWGESGLPVLFLHHLRTALQPDSSSSIFLSQLLLWLSRVFFVSKISRFFRSDLLKLPLVICYGLHWIYRLHWAA